MLAVRARGLSQNLKLFILYKHRPLTTLSAAKRVGTHDGTFHCDEALACSILRLTNAFSNAQIVRTWDPQVLDTLDAVLDVVGMYDPSRHRFDHHQNEFDQVFGHGFTTKLSIAGLVYKHYGLEIIAKELQLDERHPNVHRLFLAVYKNFVEVHVPNVAPFSLMTNSFT